MDNGSSFQQWKNGYPSVSTYDLAIQEREADLVIATFGRAVYILDDIRPLRKLAAAKGVLPSGIAAFSPGEAYLASFRNAPGYDWSNWGLWDAENRPRGAAISYFINPALQSDTSTRKPKLDSVWVRIFNEKNENIRNLKWKADTGINRRYWNMDEKGFRTPGSPRPPPGSIEPAGPQVLPGNYKIVFSIGALTDSTVISVKDDPRIGNRNEIKLAQRALQNRLRESSDKLVEGMDRLNEAEETTQKIDAQTRGMDGKAIDSLRRSTKMMQDGIKALREFINGKAQTRQGYGSVPQITVMNQWQQASSAITSKPIIPGKQEQMLVERSEGLIREAVQRINNFFETKWKAYRKLAEETPVNLFKDYRAIE